MESRALVAHDFVRVLNLDGTISDLDFKVIDGKCDRRGRIALLDREGSIVKFHNRRIMPPDYVFGKAVVLENHNKYYALCPLCGSTGEVDNKEKWVCQSHGELNLYWLCAVPEFVRLQKPRTLKMNQTKLIFDVMALAELENCELFTKSGVRFDHERVDVRSHVLLLTAESSRKLCFNTYDGGLGKKRTTLPIDEFLQGVKGPGINWYHVKDAASAREKLLADGYVLITKEVGDASSDQKE